MPHRTDILDNQLVSEAVRRALEKWFAAVEPVDHPRELFHAPRAQALKKQIVRVGRKLWQREYVDGNGGNISARLSPELVICTPTLVSKGDLRIEDLSLVDLDNCLIAGNRPRTSEIHLHLEIYKQVAQAQAIIHCHPPYATAHAIAGLVPQPNLLPEQEVLVGPVALAPYETPGTLEFAKTVLPMVQQHNTILLANHGIVCWADSVSHAAWRAEVIETYCKTVMIASHLRSPLPQIPPNKVDELLAIKRRLGLPDARLPLVQSGEQKPRTGSEDSSGAAKRNGDVKLPLEKREMEALVSIITAEVIRAMEPRR